MFSTTNCTDSYSYWVADALGDLILITREDGGVELANDAFVRAVGYSRQELAGLCFGDLVERGFGAVLGHISSEVRARGIWRGR